MQTRYTKFKDPVNSLPLNEKYLGIIPAAVYCGFDTMVNTSGLDLELSHSVTGEIFTKQDGTQTPRRGAWLTHQGTVIKEDANIPLTLESNSTNAAERIDYLVGRHLHDIIYPGGVAATYEIIKGPLNNPIPPTLPNPEDSTILGIFRLPAGSSSAALAKWERARIPGLGNMYPALLEVDNRFGAQQQEKQQLSIVTIADNTTVEAGGHRGVLGAINGANTFLVEGYNTLDLLPDKPEGTIINLVFTQAGKIRGFVSQLDGGISGLGNLFGYNIGLRPIVISYNDSAELDITRDTVVQLVKVKTGVTWNSSTDHIFGDYWMVVSVGDAAFQVKALNEAVTALNTTVSTLTTQVATLGPKPYEVRDVYLSDPSTEFDLITRKGKADGNWAGWTIFDEAKGRVSAGWDADDGNFATIGAKIGATQESLTIDQLPSHYFNSVVSNVNGGEVHIGTGNAVFLAAKSENGGSGREYRLTGVQAPNVPNTGRTNTIGNGTPVSRLQKTIVMLKVIWIPTP